MKKINLKLFGLVVLQGFLFMSCGQNNNSSSPAAGRCDNRNAAGCGGAVTAQGNTDIALQGLFYGSDQDAFQIAAAALVSATVTPNALGKVSDGQYQNNTGIAFGGKVSVASGKFTAAPAGTAVVATGRMLVAVFDDRVGQQATTGQVIGPILIPMSTVSGTVGGGSANVIFTDSFGSIQFQGQYDANNFTGTVQFTNTMIVGGAGSATGQFSFEVPTCSFFVCN